MVATGRGSRLVTPGCRGRSPPCLDVQLTLRGSERPAHLVGLGQGDASGLGNDLEHLLVEDHDAVGLLQRWFEAGVEVLRRTPVLTGQQERGDHCLLYTSDAEQRDVDDE